MSPSPIIITGCPRSGTKMMGRVFGALSQSHCLVSEHEDKQAEIPEDESGVNDHQLWWDVFRYEKWDQKRSRPLVDIPTSDPAAISRIRNRYLEIAGNRRLVIKNPSHILYPEIVSQIFPDAKFVYCLRDPWTTLHSMTKSGRDGFLLRSPRAIADGASLLHQAAIGWSDAVSQLEKWKNERWYVSRYESMLENPENEIQLMCEALELDDIDGFSDAIQIPKPSPNQHFYYIKKAYQKSTQRDLIRQEVSIGSNRFQYANTPVSMPGTVVDHYRGKLRQKWQRFISGANSPRRAA
ncbi:sulfotransferase family protein [Neorhodopirellula lusitana]|uniref:sulfotransferase family protein n=1 Tax=Neorhodopirellula lusitana TaxID=445327 RepID=UPI00384BCC75